MSMTTLSIPPGTFQLGTWISSGAPVVTEIAADAGFDWLLLDLEHGNGTEADIPNQLRACRGSSAKPVVRVGSPDAALIGRVLDWGAAGIMVPHVDSPHEAAACVDAMRYPPKGHRGVSRSVRAYGYGQKPFPSDSEKTNIFLAQIETFEAVQQAEEIATVDGVDVLFVGPSDLQFNLSTRPSPAPLNYLECIQHVAAAARSAGKSSGILVRDVNDIDSLREMGFQWLAIDSDLGLLRTGYQKCIAMIKRNQSISAKGSC